jgi:hypothetical protein
LREKREETTHEISKQKSGGKTIEILECNDLTTVRSAAAWGGTWKKRNQLRREAQFAIMYVYVCVWCVLAFIAHICTSCKAFFFSFFFLVFNNFFDCEVFLCDSAQDASNSLTEDVSRFHDLVNSLTQNTKPSAARSEKAQQALKKDRDAAKQLVNVIHTKLQSPPASSEEYVVMLIYCVLLLFMFEFLCFFFC